MYPTNLNIAQKLMQLNYQRPPKLVIVVAMVTMMIMGLVACQPIRPVNAANASDIETANQEECTLATLKGRYLFAHSGTFLPPAFGVTEPTPGADAGFHIFNGDGTGTDTVTLRVGTEIVLENFAVPITYTINADCTGSLTPLVPDGPSFNLFIAPNGGTFAIISTAPPGNLVSGFDIRVSSE
jgi:hypothetical protein